MGIERLPFEFVNRVPMKLIRSLLVTRGLAPRAPWIKCGDGSDVGGTSMGRALMAVAAM
jgi:hypothetical protein